MTNPLAVLHFNLMNDPTYNENQFLSLPTVTAEIIISISGRIFLVGKCLLVNLNNSLCFHNGFWTTQ